MKRNYILTRELLLVFVVITLLAYKIEQPKARITGKITEPTGDKIQRENHPDVGYLMACSTDEAAYKTANKSIRMQRTGTIMEGNEICDFRVYAVS